MVLQYVCQLQKWLDKENIIQYKHQRIWNQKTVLSQKYDKVIQEINEKLSSLNQMSPSKSISKYSIKFALYGMHKTLLFVCSNKLWSCYEQMHHVMSKV